MIKEVVEDADIFVVMPDCTGAKDLKWSEGESKGGKACKKGAGVRAETDSESKFQPLDDVLSFPLQFILYGGKQHGFIQAVSWLAAFRYDAVRAERGYETDPLREMLAAKRIEMVMPSHLCRQQQWESDRLHY